MIWCARYGAQDTTWTLFVRNDSKYRFDYGSPSSLSDTLSPALTEGVKYTVTANYENPLKGYHRDCEPLERFFRNLIMGERNELKNRYLLVGISDAEKAVLGKGGKAAAEKRSEKGGQKKAARKGGQKTIDRLLALIASHPHITQAGMVAAIGITRSTIQKHIANLKAAGRLRRIGPDKGGHWEAVE